MVLGLTQRQVMAVALPLVAALLMAGLPNQPDDNSWLFEEFSGDPALELMQKKAKKLESKALVTQPPPPPACMAGCDGDVCALVTDPTRCQGDKCKCGTVCGANETKDIESMCNNNGPPPPACMVGCDGDVCALATDPSRCQGDKCKCGTVCGANETKNIESMCNNNNSDGRPPCAMSCPKVEGEPTCDMIKTFMNGPMGCAATCSAEIKSHAMSKACGKSDSDGRPPCAMSCPKVEGEPTCDMIKTFMNGPMGCAATCSAEIKSHAMSKACGKSDSDGRPPCAMSCPKVEGEPTCDMVMQLFSPLGCAATCSAEIKSHAMSKACGKNDKNNETRG